MARDAEFNIRAKDKTQKAFNSVQKSLRSIKQSAGAVSGALKGLAIAAVAAAGPAALGAVVRSNLAAIDSLAKTADKLGITTEALSGLRHAAELTGVSHEKLDMGLQRFTRRVSEAAAGTGEARAALKELGLDANQLNLLGPRDAFAAVADAMQGVESQSNRVRLGFKLFDSEGVALINTLRLGSKGLAEMDREAEKLGITVSRVDAAQIEAANDALERMKQAIAGVGRVITVALAPFITTIANRFRDAAAGAQAWRVATIEAMESVITGIGFLSSAFTGLKVIWKTLELAFAGFVATIANSLRVLTRDILAIASHLPGIGDDIARVNEAIGEFALGARLEVVALGKEIFTLATAEPAADGIKRFLAEVKRAAAESQEAFRLPSIEPIDAGATFGIPVDTPEVTESKLETLRENLATVETVSQEHQIRLAESLNIALVQRQKMHREANTSSAKAQRYWENRRARDSANNMRHMARFEAAYLHDKVRSVASAFAEITAGVAHSNKTLFAINKVAAISSASINAVLGASKTLASYPFYIGVPLAATHLAAGMAKVAAIRSQAFGSGGHIPSTAAGGAPSAINAGGSSFGGGFGGGFGGEGGRYVFNTSGDRYWQPDKKEPAKFIEINIDGNPTKDQLRELIEHLNDEIDDGTVLTTS